MIEVSVLVDKLNGMRWQDIVTLLGTAGVTGVREEEDMCALANWLRRESGLRVSVGIPFRDEQSFQRYGVGIQEDEEEETYSAYYALEDEVMYFIRKFDEGEFPELVTPYEVYD